LVYRVEIRRQAAKELARIGLDDRRRIAIAVDGLSRNPRPAGCRKLQGREGWRIRVGVYRVLYRIEDLQLLVLVVKIGHRGDVYREA
jgi:mRNA interferase RelE/StbE